MSPFEEKDIRLLAEVLPNIAVHLRSSMANICAAANRIAPSEARENDPALDQNAAILSMSCQQMLRLVGNLSTAGELVQDGHFPLYNNDVVPFCRSLCERAEPYFELRGLKLRFSADRESKVIAMNAPMLERALLNLLSNALKFTSAGGIVSVQVKCSERTVHITVTDTGCGIPSDRLEHIFERYLETDRLDPAPHGLGLGLPLCRRIAQGHGGTLVAESVEGKGSSFTISLPGVRSAEARLEEARFDYAGGFDHVLMELSDALPHSAFIQRYLD